MRAAAEFILLVALVAAAAAGDVRAQSDWPSKPIRWVVPFPPGGPADVTARLVAHKLGERLGQPNLVESRPGAGGNVGHAFVAKSAPDGYTLLFTVTGIVSNPFFIKASTDPFSELATVIQFNTASLVLLAHPDFPARTVHDVVALARAKPNAVSCGVAGALPQVCCEVLRAFVKNPMLMVPYKGNAPALNALIAGEINLLFDLPNTALGQVQAGRARPIATTAPKRGIGPFGDLPVLVDSIPDFDIATWQGVTVPRATPRPIVQRLNRELNAVLADPDLRQRFAASGFEVVGGTPEAFEQHLRREYERYRKVLTAAGVKPE
jgi:tripartite-type tricarboxylate transporter receptor subunit TctC